VSRYGWRVRLADMTRGRPAAASHWRALRDMRGWRARSDRRRWWLGLLVAWFSAHCAGEGSAHSPTCGLAQVVGPSLIQQQLINPASVLTEPPRGLASSLPARVVGQSDQGEVLVARADTARQLIMGYQGSGFPAPPGGYGLLVVDDSTERALGVLVYESDPPRGDPVLGSVTGVDRSVPLFGVRVSWASVSNPRCPLLGAPILIR
jgi:hypothetical protein